MARAKKLRTDPLGRARKERDEVLAFRAATDEILTAISRSASDTKPVFAAIVDCVRRLFGTRYVAVFLVKGEELHLAAAKSDAEREKAGVFRSFRESFPQRIDWGGFTGKALRSGKVSQIAPIIGNPKATPQAVKLAKEFGYNAMLVAPLVRDGKTIGAIGTTRPEAKPFDARELALFKAFAAQAVIAIENARLFNETKEALEQQTASSDILRVISSSPTDVQPVLDAVAESAARLCDSNDAMIRRVDPDGLRRVAHFGPLVGTAATAVHPITADSVGSRAVLERRAIHVEDIEEEFRKGRYLEGRARQAEHRYRSMLAMPLLREGAAIGVILIRRQEQRPFTEKQIALLKTFADQAVIAIENVRLFNETREALEQQTASAAVLRVLGSSPSDLQPVFEAILENAMRLCDASLATVGLYDGKLYRHVAQRGGSPEYVKFLFEGPFEPNPQYTLGRMIAERQPFHTPDYRELPAYREGNPRAVATVELGGTRTHLAVPMLKDGQVIGGITVRRTEVRPFTQKQIDLVKTFADQAVIAIENARLFNETKEALEQQKASAEILSAISSSIADTRPVFDRIALNCEHLFGGVEVIINLIGADGLLYIAGHQGAHREHLERNFKGAPVSRESGAGRCILEKRSMQYPDIEGGEDVPPVLRANCAVTSVKACMYAPLVWEDQGIGAIFVGRRYKGPFSGKEMALLKTFADQAVIAIQNARLFRELQERTEALTRSVDQLTALGEVGQAISSTLDLETVLKTIVSRAVQLTGLDGGTIYEFDERGREFHLRAAENMPDELAEVYRRMPIRLGEGIVGGAAAKREPVQVPDIQDPSYQTRYRELLLRQGYRAILAVPLLREDQIIGALTVSRNEPGAFAPEVIDLLKTFASQSALAIQNARLFREIAEKSRELELASRHKSQFLASMSHELRTPLNALLGFNEMILGDVYGEVPGDMKPPLAQMQASGKHLLRLINNVLDLAKIEAGRMELALSDYSVHDTVESVRSALRPLAVDKGLELLAAVPADIPLAYGDAGRITQCLMNLAGNSLKFTKAGKVEIAVVLDDGRLRYSVADTGIGIPADKIESLFTEFKQTDAAIASEYGGTGLGLSITKKFVELHGGRIWVASEPGRGSTFSFEIPLRAQEAKAA
jgi:GAF domain-containing protein/anti-sigma regulatory factor (Ser/Thr protein kinase)